MIQLKLRTEYSFGQTFAPLKKMVAYLKAHGCTAAGIVDANTWGHVAWYKACVEAGIQPLLGAEVVVSDEDENTPSMWFLASNTAALSELYKAMSLSHQQPIRTKRGSVPRLYHGDVTAMSEDILKFAGTVVEEGFLHQVSAYVDLFPSSQIMNDIKGTLGRPLVYVSDNAYIAPEHRGVYEVMAKAGTKPTAQHILLDLPHTDEMRTIARRCEGLMLPMAPMIAMAGDLEALCRTGVIARKMESIFATDARYETRLSYELDIIRQKNYQSYFIVVADMVAYAKQHMLVGPSRGSAAGSLVCYLAGITEIDPIPPGLFFERFIDITRKDLPDIDLDFPDDKRLMVFEYMAKQYGGKNVAHIGTVSKYAPRSALIQVCKAMDIPPSATAGVKTAMITRSSADARANACLEDTLKDTEPGRKFLADYPHAAICGQIEGHAQHTGVHAAGLIICNDEIQNYATVDSHGIAHIEMKSVADLGLLKIDVLGLTTLSVLEQSGIVVDWYNLPLNDPKAYEVFNSGRMCGIFQFEGDAMRSIATQMKIENINDVDAVTALARPGPFAGGVTFKYLQRRRGEQPVEQIHPLVEPFMRQSYGLPIYQEQTLAICREIGNFGWKETAAIRRAMSKSLGVEFFNTYWKMFREGAASHGISEGIAWRTWEMIMTMGSWQMNKAHTYSYAVISYWCLAGYNLLYDWEAKEYISLAKAYRNGLHYTASYNEKTGRTVKGKILKIIRTTGAKNINLKMGWEVFTKSHKRLVCSAEHEILTPSGYRRLRDLNVGDLVASEKRVSIMSPARRARIARGLEQDWARLSPEERERQIQSRQPTTAVRRQAAQNTWDSMPPQKRRKRIQQYVNIEREKGWDKRRRGIVSQCGHHYASSNELFVCAWLNSHGIMHESQAHIGTRYADWKVKGVYVEFDGCGRNEMYFEKKFGDEPYLVLRHRDEVEDKLAFLLEEEALRAGATVSFEPIKSIKRLRPMVMYDIVMENSPHNFLANGIVVHNCAWLKGHYPLEFAASTLRNTMSEASAQELLREMIREGITHIAFDPELSEENWAVKDGKLVGGYTALKGIGPAFARKYLGQRAAGKLTQKDRDRLSQLPNAFTLENLFPINKKYGALYGDDERWRNAQHIHGRVLKIADILKDEVPSGHFIYLMGSLIKKNPHNINEEPIMKKQGRTTKITDGPLEYLDLRLKDDTGTIGGRIQKERYKTLGLPITEKVEVGAEMVVRATFYRDGQGKFIPYAFITNWKRLDVPNSPWMGEISR